MFGIETEIIFMGLLMSVVFILLAMYIASR
jgi:hypothetical protein